MIYKKYPFKSFNFYNKNSYSCKGIVFFLQVKAYLLHLVTFGLNGVYGVHAVYHVVEEVVWSTEAGIVLRSNHAMDQIVKSSNALSLKVAQDRKWRLSTLQGCGQSGVHGVDVV